MGNFSNWTYDRKFIFTNLPSFENAYNFETKLVCVYLLPSNNGTMRLTKVLDAEQPTYTLQHTGINGEVSEEIDYSIFVLLKLSAVSKCEKIVYKLRHRDSNWTIDQYTTSKMGNIIIGTVKVIHLEEPVEFMDVVGVEITNDMCYHESNLMVDKG